MTDDIAGVDEFVDAARKVTIVEAAERLGIALKGSGPERCGPCPCCGGKDRFSVNLAKNAWNCRGSGGGRDAIGMAAHVAGFDDLTDRTAFLAACADVLGRPVPDGGARESDADRADRMARMAARMADADDRAAKVEESSARYREKAVRRARGIYLNAGGGPGSEPGSGETSAMADYLRARTGFAIPEAVFANLRFAARHTYWHKGRAGEATSLFSGPAMIAPIVTLERTVTGCHETWIDLSAGPKFRPTIADPDAPDVFLVSKKMQGVKKGGLIPLCGFLSATRWVSGEGIENVLAIAGAEDFRADTFYCAAGDLGNLSGPADPASGFHHPALTRTDKRGRARALKIAGPVPAAGSEGDAMPVPEHVRWLVILADGDSEIYATAAAIARTIARHARPGRIVEDWWAPPGMDWAQVIVQGRADQAHAEGSTE